jgi:2-C-methyl-D-erythritol 2,4-cyclodiphosphate synthase
MDFRIGQGYDVHALVPGRPLIIGGVTIPYERGLLGHSDADVLLHAITDAIFGAAAMGDIGRHFSDTDANSLARIAGFYCVSVLLALKPPDFLSLMWIAVWLRRRPSWRPISKGCARILLRILICRLNGSMLKLRLMRSWVTSGAGRVLKRRLWFC